MEQSNNESHNIQTIVNANEQIVEKQITRKYIICGITLGLFIAILLSLIATIVYGKK